MRERREAIAFVGVWLSALLMLGLAIGHVVPIGGSTDGPVTASLEVRGPSWTLTYRGTTEIASSFGLLREANLTLGFELRWVEYGWPYDDVFVTSINGTANDGSANLWWQYCVNGRYAESGAAKQALHEGDSVVWVYERPGGSELCD